MITITEASDATRVSKSTILRSIKSGRISASRNDAGAFMIDPAELARVFPDASRRDSPANQDAAPEATDVAVARLTAELEGERRLAAELREDRDQWRDQARRLAIAGPQAAPAQRQGLLARLFG